MFFIYYPVNFYINKYKSNVKFKQSLKTENSL